VRDATGELTDRLHLANGAVRLGQRQSHVDVVDVGYARVLTYVAQATSVQAPAELMVADAA
jgi:hypothetical protein